MGVVDRIVLPLTYVCRKGLSLIVVTRRIVGLAVVLNKVIDKGVGARRVIWGIGKGQYVLDRAVREAYFILPELKEILGRFLSVGFLHAPSQLTKACFVPHRPFLDGLHPRYGVFYRGERHTAKLGMELFQPFTQAVQEVLPPCIVTFEGPPEAFPRTLQLSALLQVEQALVFVVLHHRAPPIPVRFALWQAHTLW